jgi:phosphohistidine phosphatase
MIAVCGPDYADVIPEAMRTACRQILARRSTVVSSRYGGWEVFAQTLQNKLDRRVGWPEIPHMELFLLRHGPAVERGTPGFENDFARPLTAKGKRQLRQSCAALRMMKLKWDLILASPLVRARQTAEIVAAELKVKKRLCFSHHLQPGGNPKQLVAELNRLKPAPKTILLVGHEPDLSELISLLVTGKTGAGFALKKGGLAKLEAETLSADKCATLAWLLTPKQMKWMV